MGRALVIGIDDYKATPLKGCVADAREMERLLSHNYDGSINYDVKRITSDGKSSITRGSLRAALAGLFDNARDADLLFFYAGHGAQTAWGGELVTQDYTPNSLGVSMNDVITLANKSAAREVVVILDCCFSGDMANIPGMQSDAVAEQFRKGLAVLRENVTLLSAARATEPSQEYAGHGNFTRLLINGLEGAAANLTGEVTALSLYAHASKAFGEWDQRPVFKSHATRPSILRHALPWIDPALLRRLPDHFESVESRVQLTPAHEGEGRPLPDDDPGSAKQQEFDYFKELRNAGLLETEGNQDLYFLATQTLGEVFLTSKGQYFWQLVDQGRL
jgi:hypothetical protein